MMENEINVEKLPYKLGHIFASDLFVSNGYINQSWRPFFKHIYKTVILDCTCMNLEVVNLFNELNVLNNCE